MADARTPNPGPQDPQVGTASPAVEPSSAALPDPCTFGRFALHLGQRQLLLDVVWPGLVVEENNLQVQMSSLRKVLGPRAIATVPGRGYRFVAPLGSTPAAAGVQSLPLSPSAAVAADPKPERPAHRGRVLVADDNKVNRLLLARALMLQGHEVATADDGQQALAMLRREPFDLLLLDLEMPELDGFALLEIVAVDAALREVGVIITSSLEGAANVARCIELGAEDFLHKPVHPLLLKARVASSLEKKRLRDRQRALVERLAAGHGLAALPGGSSGAAASGRVTHDAAVLSARLVGFSAGAAALPAGDVLVGKVGPVDRTGTVCTRAAADRAMQLQALAGSAGLAALVDHVRDPVQRHVRFAADRLRCRRSGADADGGDQRCAGVRRVVELGRRDRRRVPDVRRAPHAPQAPRRQRHRRSRRRAHRPPARGGPAPAALGRRPHADALRCRLASRHRRRHRHAREGPDRRVAEQRRGPALSRKPIYRNRPS